MSALYPTRDELERRARTRWDEVVAASGIEAATEASARAGFPVVFCWTYLPCRTLVQLAVALRIRLMEAYPTTVRIERDPTDLESGYPQLDVEPFPTGEERYARLTRMVREHACATFAYDNQDGCLLLDVQTAHLLRQVADALQQTNRAKFLALDLGVMVDTAWKLVS